MNKQKTIYRLLAVALFLIVPTSVLAFIASPIFLSIPMTIVVFCLALQLWWFTDNFF
jgi:hypothetical protein